MCEEPQKEARTLGIWVNKTKLQFPPVRCKGRTLFEQARPGLWELSGKGCELPSATARVSHFEKNYRLGPPPR